MNLLNFNEAISKQIFGMASFFLNLLVKLKFQKRCVLKLVS